MPLIVQSLLTARGPGHTPTSGLGLVAELAAHMAAQHQQTQLAQAGVGAARGGRDPYIQQQAQRATPQPTASGTLGGL